MPLGALDRDVLAVDRHIDSVGYGTGCFPMRDMASSPSPHVREDFAAHALSCRLTVGQQARDVEMIATPRPPRTRGRLVDFAYTRRRAWTPGAGPRCCVRGWAVLQLDHQRLADPSILGVVVADVPSLLRISAMFALILECGSVTSS